MPEEIKKYPSGKKGICINCRREKFINDKHGHCKACGDVVKGLTPDTPEYSAALTAVKTRLTDPDRKRPLSPRKAQALRNKVIKQLDHAKKINARRKSTLDMTIPEVVHIGMSRIIEMINAEIAMYMAEVDKLQKAKSIIERA